MRYHFEPFLCYQVLDYQLPTRCQKKLSTNDNWPKVDLEFSSEVGDLSEVSTTQGMDEVYIGV